MNLRSIYRHYWPDTAPYGSILRAILEDRAARGDDVEILTAQPSYNDISAERLPARESSGAVRIRRIGLPRDEKAHHLRRGANFGLFLARSGFIVARGTRPDLILVNGHPPVGMGILARSLRRWHGTSFIYHCQDIHPEVLLTGGQLSDGPLYRALRALDTKTCDSAAAVVVLSEDMRETLRQRGVRDEKILVINNFPASLERGSADVSSILADIPIDAFLVLFAGNLGNFQGLDALAAAARKLSQRLDIHFAFMGSGSAEARLRSQTAALQGRTVHFLGQHSVAAARSAMTRADLGVVSLLPGVHRVAYPSKLMNYVTAPCPVLAIVEDHSSIADDVRRLRLGYVCGERSADAIAHAIEHAFRERVRWNPGEREALRLRGEAHFGQVVAMEKWNDLFERLSGSGRGKP